MQSQELTAKGANANQLAVYFAIGKYLSKNTRRFVYGSGALKAISDRLLHEMPGLRCFSETSLKKNAAFL
ncbi:MAG: hypothetical protein IK032_08055 [Bacteroidales bacterium]|nr:hypothetical protein [Bacteroidales bacterium]